MTSSKPAYQRGEVVLVNFVFPDETGIKRRPTLILSTDAYQQDRKEVIVAAITSNIRRVLIGDHLISDWKEAGLLYPSTVTGIIRTVKQEMIDRRLGALALKDLQAVEQNLRRVLGL
jgi:mRNA interferase MazF